MSDKVLGARVLASEMDGRMLIATDVVREDVLCRILVAIDPDGFVRVFRLRLERDGGGRVHLLVTGVTEHMTEWLVPSPGLVASLSKGGYPLGIMFDLVEGWPKLESDVWGFCTLHSEEEVELDEDLAEQLRRLFGEMNDDAE